MIHKQMSGFAHVKLHLQKHYNLTYTHHKIFFFQAFQPFANLNTSLTSQATQKQGVAHEREFANPQRRMEIWFVQIF